MAVELEQEVMRDIGLGRHYGYYNGSGSCRYIAKDAVDKLSSAMEKYGLSLSARWASHCRKAIEVDDFDGEGYSLTNTWIACSYAIQDGIYRKESGKGFSPREDWQFFDDDKERQWKSRSRSCQVPVDDVQEFIRNRFMRNKKDNWNR